LGSLWDHRPSKVEISLCKAHGKACAKGICKEHADQLKQEKQERYELDKAKAKNNKRGRGGASKVLIWILRYNTQRKISVSFWRFFPWWQDLQIQ
jgi:hypothetical protein